MNPLFSAMGGGAPNLMQMVQHLRQNPMQLLMQRNLNVPQDLAQDPNAIMQHLLKTGQINQQQINQAYQAAQRLGLKK